MNSKYFVVPKSKRQPVVNSLPAVHQDVRVVGTAVHKGEERGYVPMHSDTCQGIGVQEHSDIKEFSEQYQELPNNQQLRGLWANQGPRSISARGEKGDTSI